MSSGVESIPARPPRLGRVIYLVAKLVCTRAANRLRAGLRRKRTTDDGRRRGTARKAPLGRAGLVLVGLLMIFNSLNITAQILRSARAALPPVHDAQGRIELLPQQYARLGQIDAIVAPDDPEAMQDLQTAVRHALRAGGGPGTRTNEDAEDAIIAQYARRGIGGFCVLPETAATLFFPTLLAWHSPAHAEITAIVSTLVLLLSIAWLFTSLGNANQDLGKVEWTLEWLFTFPIQPRHLFLAQILGYAVAAPLCWVAAFPMFFVIFWSAGFRWGAVGLGFVSALHLSLMIAALRLVLETVLRTTQPPARLKNLQAMFTVAGIMTLFVLLATVGQSVVATTFFDWALTLPPSMAWLPFTVALQWCVRDLSAAALWIGCGFFVPCAAMLICAARVRHGLIASAGGFEGQRGRASGAKSISSLRGIVGKDLRLLLRDRNFLVQTLVVPVLVLGFQLVLNAGILNAVQTNFQHAAVLAFFIGGYVLIATALAALSVEGNSVWLLFTLPRSLPAILLQKTCLWAGVALLYTIGVLAICARLNPHLTAWDAGFAVLAIVGVAIYAFIAAGLGILGTDPMEPEVRRRVRHETVWLYMLLAAMFAHALYQASVWAWFAQIILSMLLACALWQKVRDRAPYLLDPVATPPAAVSLADGLIAALAFFVLQGLAALLLQKATLSAGTAIFLGFVVAGAAVVAGVLFIFWRARVKGVLASVGLVRRSRDDGASWFRALWLGVLAGSCAAALAWAYIAFLAQTPFLNRLQQESPHLPPDLGPWLPVLAVAAAPLFEEFIFRGLVYRGLRRSTSPAAAMAGSAAIFAIVHPPISVIPVFILGIAAAWSFERSKLLLSAVVTHAVYNAAILLRGVPY
jgi:membrane protease YdiL (CAAX protease family)